MNCSVVLPSPLCLPSFFDFGDCKRLVDHSFFLIKVTKHKKSQPGGPNQLRPCIRIAAAEVGRVQGAAIQPHGPEVIVLQRQDGTKGARADRRNAVGLDVLESHGPPGKEQRHIYHVH